MEKEFNNENTLETVENTEAVTEQASGDVKDPPKSAWKAYVPRFTEASERYRVKGDSRIRERFGIKQGEQSYTVWQCDDAYTVDPENFSTKGRATPFAGHKLLGTCITTIHGGKIVWKTK